MIRLVESLLKEQVRNDEQITGMLTSYNGMPAFFYQKCPSDTDKLWDKSCYPRADYNVDMQYNPERKSDGILQINIECSSDCEFMPEDIEKQLRKLINTTFYSSGLQSPVCAVWNRSDAFSIEKNDSSLPEIYGVSMLFDLMEFPSQITTDPDPVQGLNEWTKAHFPECMLIAYDVPPNVWKPTDKCPAVYWRFAGSDTDSKNSSYAVMWFIGHFAAHIMADSVTERNRWLKAIAEQIQRDGEVILQDESPMFIKQLSIRHSADSLHEGQLDITGQYGVLTREYAGCLLNNINKNYGGESNG